jgi:DNA-binding NtrC family response regulator
MASDMESRAENSAPGSVAGPLQGARILVVEDDFFIAMELESILTDAGGQVVGLCRTVEDALASAATGDFVVALLDFRMGEETTMAVAQRLATRHVPFAFYTGQAQESLFVDWPDCRVLSKPAQPQTVIDTLADLLRGDRASA